MRILIACFLLGAIAATVTAQDAPDSPIQPPAVAEVIDQIAEIYYENELRTVQVEVPVRKVRILEQPRQFNIHTSVSSVPTPVVQSVPCVECIPVQQASQVCVTCDTGTTQVNVGPEPPSPSPGGILRRLCERLRSRGRGR